FVTIEDMEGWGYYSNNDTLGKMYLVHVSSVFMAAWKLVYSFLDSNTKKKIVFVENKKLKSTPLEDMDEIQLPS
ncbi:hypothetical protein MKX01_000128, partial [Papaver californicum]